VQEPESLYTPCELFIYSMTRHKLRQFEEIAQMPHVFEMKKEMKGHWKEYFGNANPIIVELACGKGDYTVGMARLFPDKNFIGMDIKGNRIWRGAKTVEEEKISNAAFLRGQIEDLLEYFDTSELSEIWITFPDPHLPLGKARKRLTSPRFLAMYAALLPKNGILHLKTDSRPLFDYSLETIHEHLWSQLEKIEDLYQTEHITRPIFQIQTYYELMHLKDNRKIYYCAWQKPEVTI